VEVERVTDPYGILEYPVTLAMTEAEWRTLVHEAALAAAHGLPVTTLDTIVDLAQQVT
jgi:hypothetical protein